MLKQKIISFILIGSALTALFGSISVGAVHAEPLAMLDIDTIYAGVSGVPNGNYNDIGRNQSGVYLIPNKVGASGYRAYALKILISDNITTSIDNSEYYIDMTLSFMSDEYDNYKASITFATPRAYNSNDQYLNQVDFFGDCFTEEFYDSSTRVYFNRNLTQKAVTMNYEGTAHQVHIHIGCKSMYPLGTYYAFVGLASVQINSLSCTKNGVEYEADYLEERGNEQVSENEDSMAEAEDEMSGVTSSFDSITSAFQGLVANVSTTSTDVPLLYLPAMYIPQTSVTPRLNLSSEEPIDFNDVLEDMPSSVMGIARAVCSIAIYFFAVKEVIKIFHNVFGNKEDTE